MGKMNSTFRNHISRHIQELKQDMQTPTRQRLNIEVGELIDSFTDIAKLMYPYSEYKIDKHNKEIIENIMRWIIGDPAGPYDLNKGICLQGPKGTGKTWTMWSLSQLTAILPPITKYSITRTQEIASEYEEGGWEAIKKYTKRNRLFDDLGEEKKDPMHYGTRSNVMEEILTSRYWIRKTTGMMTHATTNYRQEEFMEFYGSRVTSRLTEIFNFVIMDGPDRRK